MNVGKRFEEDFKRSVPDYCFKHRLRDSAQSFIDSGKSRYSWDNECDFFMFDTKRRTLFTIELKTTKYKSMDFDIDGNSKNSKMIKHHQIKSLTDFSQYKNIIPCFLFNFRTEDSDKKKSQRCYFMRIQDFNSMVKNIGKKSFNEIDLLMNGAVKVDGKILRVNYKWDIDGLLHKILGDNF